MTIKWQRDVFFVFIVVTVCMPVHPVDALVEDVIEVLKLGKDIASTLLETWNLVDQTHGGDDVQLPFRNKRQKEILKRINEVSGQINRFEDNVLNSGSWTVDAISNFVMTNTKLELNLHELTDLLNRMKTEEKNMRDFTNNFHALESSTLLDFAYRSISLDTVQGYLDRIHLLAVGSNELDTVGGVGVLQLLASSMEEAQTMVCYSRQSPQQVLFHMYNAVSIAELKGYAMMQFSWMILRNYGKGNYTKESHLMRERFMERSGRAQDLLQKLLERADRSIHRCDPKHHVENETYIAVTRLLQGYIENEVDMNKDGTCRENCAAYTLTESYGCFKDQFCARQPRCKGKIMDCQFIDSDMWVCLANSKSTRRYDFIEYENGRTLGKRRGCSNQETKTDSWWRWVFWHCSYCMCFCDEQGEKSDRYFNLREVVSDVANNKVITGVRFRKINRIIHIQIQEGVLQQRGYVNASTVSWKPVADYKLLDRGIRSGVDYHTLTADKRAINLDTLNGLSNTVLTGLRFKVYGRHMNLEAQFTEIDFVTGKLKNADAEDVGKFWQANDNTPYSKENRRTEIKLDHPDIPILSKHSEILSTDNQYIQFTHSDVDKDVAQTTVPFMDALDVISKIPVALNGIGIYYKGQQSFGGFIGMKLITYNFAPHVIPPDFSGEDDYQYVPLDKH